MFQGLVLIVMFCLQHLIGKSICKKFYLYSYRWKNCVSFCGYSFIWSLW